MRKLYASRWNYTLKCGKALRQAINDDEPEEILELLKQAWAEIHKNFPEEYDEFEYESDIEDIDSNLDDLMNYEEYDMSYEDVEDSINHLLDNLYDFCDGFRIWIGL